MNNDALRYWCNALKPDFPIDTDTFLLTSLIPISYVEFGKEADYVVVDVADIRKETKCAEEGIAKLIKSGYAKWYGKDNKAIAIGTSNGAIRTCYFFSGASKQAEPANTGGMTLVTDQDMQPTLDLLEGLYDNYKKFCEKTRSQKNADDVFKKVNSSIKAAYGGKFTPQGLVSYFNGVNAMMFEWVTIPSRPTMKDIGVAKNLIDRFDSRKLIVLVPFFVTEYHKFARKGYEETSIFNFSYNVNTLLTRYGKSHATTNSTAKYGDSDTL